MTASPLQPGGGPGGFIPGPLGPGQRGRLIAARARIGGQHQHVVVRRDGLGQFGVEQRVGLVKQARIAEQVGRAWQHRLALEAVAGFALGGAGRCARLGHQGGLQPRPGALGQVEPGQRNFGGHRAQPVRACELGVGGKSAQRLQPLGGERLALGAASAAQRADDLVAVVHQGVEVHPCQRGVGQHGPGERQRLRPFGQHSLVLRGGGDGLERQARRGLGLQRGAGLGQPAQRRGALRFRHQLRLVLLPCVVGELSPGLGRQRRGILAQCRGQRGLDRGAGVQRQAEHLHVLGRIDLAGQTGEFTAVGLEQDHGRVTAHLELRAEFLCAGCVTVQVNGDEGLAALGEIGPVEDRRLDLVARRAPDGAPVEKHRLVGLARLGKYGLEARTLGSDPGDGRLRAGRGLGRLRAGQQQQADGAGGAEGSHWHGAPF